jgi:hypothetical protein
MMRPVALSFKITFGIAYAVPVVVEKQPWKKVYGTNAESPAQRQNTRYFRRD